MSRVNSYQCDICKKIISKDSVFESDHYIIKHRNEYNHHKTNIDLCRNCYLKLIHLLKKDGQRFEKE